MIRPTDTMDARIAWLRNVVALRRLNILDTPPERAFDDVIEIAARLFAAPISAISLLDLDRQWFKARRGLDVAETPLAASFCRHTVLAPGGMVVSDASADIRFASNPYVTAPCGVRFYAGAPLVMSDGAAIGTVCVVDTVPRSNFTDDDRTMLAKLATLVVDLIEARAIRRAAVADA